MVGFSFNFLARHKPIGRKTIGSPPYQIENHDWALNSDRQKLEFIIRVSNPQY